MSQPRRPPTSDASTWYCVDPQLERLLNREAVWQGRLIFGLMLAGLWTSFPGGRDLLLWFVPAAIVLDLIARIPFRKRLIGYRLDRDGLHVVRYGCRERHFSWDTIQAVDETSNSLVVRTSGGELRISNDLPAAFHLAEQLRRNLGEPPAEQTELSASQLETWLGLAPGEVWTTGLQPRARFGIGAGLVGAGLVVMLNAGSPFQVWMLCVALSWVVTLLPQVAQPLEISAWGVRKGKRFAAAWDDVIGSRLTDGECTLRTVHGEISFGGAHARAVHDAVQRLLEAKQAGAVLPRLADIPDSAISRAESVEMSAERGISRPE